MKIIVDNKIPYLETILESFATVEHYPAKEITAEVVKDADALMIRTRTKCDANILDGSSVKIIATATIGFDHIDTQYCEDNGIKWANASGCNSTSVMQYLASALAYLSNKYNFDYSKMTIGIIGVGNVGSKIAHIASVLGMKVLLNDPPRMRAEGNNKFVSIEEIKQKADIITFHVPLNVGGTDNTFHLCNDNFLNSLKPETIIINSSRGEVVSTKSLIKALNTNKIKTAVLDVWENEPIIDLETFNLVDIATAHIAGYSTEGKAMGTAMAVRALSRHFGWRIESWFPKQIPSLTKQEININCSGKSSQEIINEAITATYNIAKDDKELRKSVEDFEMLRSNYPVRREFSAYKVHLLNDHHNIKEKLLLLGFKV